MSLGVARIEKINDQWMVVDPDGAVHKLEEALDGSTIYVEKDSWWEEVYCGIATGYDGEINGKPYHGPVIYCMSLGKPAGRVLTLPEATSGEWYVYKWYTDEYWRLEAGVRMRSPASGGDIGFGSLPLAPRGRCVTTVCRWIDGKSKPLGRVTLNLADMPFPKSMWFFDGKNFLEPELELVWTPEDMRLTLEVFGKQDFETFFWLL